MLNHGRTYSFPLSPLFLFLAGAAGSKDLLRARGAAAPLSSRRVSRQYRGPSLMVKEKKDGLSNSPFPLSHGNYQ